MGILTCISPHAARRSASEDRQDEARVSRAGNTACKVFTRHESRNTAFKAFGSTGERKARTIKNPRPDPRASRPVAAFLCVVVRHGAAWAACCP